MTHLTRTKLTDLCDLISVQVDPQDFPDATYIGLEHCASGRFTATGWGKARDVQSHKFSFKRGDVLYGKLRPYLDKAILADTDGVCTTELLVLRPKNEITGEFIVGVVHSPAFIEHAMSGVTGVQHPRTSWHRIAEFEIPNLSEAERDFAATLLWRTHDAIASCEIVEGQAKALKRAAMRELFAKGLRNDDLRETEFGHVPKTWTEVSLADCAIVQTGAAKGRKFADAEVINVPYLRVANVQDGFLDLTEMKNIEIRKSELERYRLLDGDVVLTEGGDFDKLGRGFIWRAQLPLCVHQNHVFAVRPDRSRLLPEYFAYLAQSHYGKSYFLKVAHKTTNLACINSAKLKAFPVLLPTLEEQGEIVTILDAIDRKILLHKEKRVVLEALFKSLLHKLMTGEVRVADLDFSALVTPKPEAA
jgi:type I restriction enzyme, S subunit